MPDFQGETVHASCVLVGARAALIRGPAGSGKSTLALALVEAGRAGRLPLARLVADDRVRIEAAHGRLVASAPETTRGLLEVRGLGIRALAWEPRAVVGLVVDLGGADAARLPPAAAQQTEIGGIALPRLAVAPGTDSLAIVLTWFFTAAHA